MCLCVRDQSGETKELAGVAEFSRGMVEIKVDSDFRVISVDKVLWAIDWIADCERYKSN